MWPLLLLPPLLPRRRRRWMIRSRLAAPVLAPRPARGCLLTLTAPAPCPGRCQRRRRQCFRLRCVPGRRGAAVLRGGASCCPGAGKAGPSPVLLLPRPPCCCSHRRCLTATHLHPSLPPHPRSPSPPTLASSPAVRPHLEQPVQQQRVGRLPKRRLGCAGLHSRLPPALGRLEGPAMHVRPCSRAVECNRGRVEAEARVLVRAAPLVEAPSLSCCCSSSCDCRPAAHSPPTPAAAYFLVAGNDIFGHGTTGFAAGQGTGFEYMVAPWLQYEAYGIQARGKRGTPCAVCCAVGCAEERACAVGCPECLGGQLLPAAARQPGAAVLGPFNSCAGPPPPPRSS